MNEKAVCRTALATQGLLITSKYFKDIKLGKTGLNGLKLDKTVENVTRLDNTRID